MKFTSIIIFTLILSSSIQAEEKAEGFENCYESTEISKKIKNTQKFFFNISKKKNSSNFDAMLDYVSQDREGSLSFNCYKKDKPDNFECGADDDSGKLSFKYTENKKTVEMKLRYANFGRLEDKNVFEIPSPRNGEQYLLKFKKVSCK